MSLSPGTRIGPYEVGAKLGAGGMGEVYRAHDTRLNRDVAIKVLAEIVATDPERLARFHREAQVLASLNHSNIAHVYGVEDASSAYGLVMELVEGPTLADRIAQGPISLDDALPIAKQIAEGLEAAHELGIVHRDLKPANIKVRDDGTVKVLDFGLAKLVDSTKSSDANLTMSPTLSLHATVAGVILGTAAYMSPEQARAKAVDKRADIWAFGCVLFEMVTGRRAFGGDDLTETIAAIVRDQPDLSQAPAQLRRLLARCFEKDPRRRLRDISDAWALVDDHIAVPDQPAAGAPGWRRALPWAFAAAAAIAAVSVLLVHLTETRFVPSPVRFQLQVPNEAGSSAPVLSPDGTRMAYRAGGQIWIRDLGSLESRAIAPTDRPVGRMFWSADSRHVVYAAAGKLMRVPAAGGSPETLRDQRLTIAGGFGLPDGGMIVSSVLTVAAGDNETVRIDTSGEHAVSGIGGQDWLRGGVSLLPDGQRFVYSVFQPEARRGVYVASIDSNTAPEKLLPDASEVAYVPSLKSRDEGYLLLVRENSLVALPIDAALLQPRGEAIVVAKGVGGFTASSSDSLVYRFDAGRRLTWYDRQGTPTGTAWSPGPYNELALSADGTRVVVVRADGPTTWVHDFARESSGRVAPTLPVAIKPMWSPKGDRILVLSTRTAGQVEFFSVAADGGGTEELVFRSPDIASPTSWSRDGRWLMYTSTNPRTKEDLWIVSTSADGAGKPEPFLVTDNKETDGTFSPDGRTVAYVSDESGTSNVYVRSFPGSGGRKWQVSTAGGYQPRWRNDSKELFYMSPSGQLTSVDITPGIASAPGRPAILFQTAVFGGGASVNNWYWDVTADGQRFLVNTVISGAEPSTLNVVLNWQSGLPR
jgi:serine/threonine protein kinase/Tol biopolymer transport system component